MAEIKPGDIVKFEWSRGGTFDGEYFFAKVREVREGGGLVGELHDRGTTGLYDEKEIGFGPIYLGNPGPRLTKVEPEFGFVGPKPEPVESPKLVLPFEADGSGIYDTDGTFVGDIGASGTTEFEDAVLAELVVRLLNEHFAAR